MNLDTREARERFDIQTSTSPAGLATGQVVQFLYGAETKNVLVLVGDWKGKLHGLALTEGMADATLENLLEELENSTADAIGLRTQYESSKYTITKPYRTYSPEKISQVKTVRLSNKKKKDTEMMQNKQRQQIKRLTGR